MAPIIETRPSRINSISSPVSALPEAAARLRANDHTDVSTKTFTFAAAAFVVVRRVQIDLPEQLDDLLLLSSLNVFVQRLVHRGPLRLFRQSFEPPPKVGRRSPDSLPCVNAYTRICVEQGHLAAGNILPRFLRGPEMVNAQCSRSTAPPERSRTATARLPRAARCAAAHCYGRAQPDRVGEREGLDRHVGEHVVHGARSSCHDHHEFRRGATFRDLELVLEAHRLAARARQIA